MAEQDRYGTHFGGGIDAKNLPDRSTFRGSSGAEQDRYGSHFGGVDAKHLPNSSSYAGSSGAEQDRYGSHFYGVDAKDISERWSFRGTSGAEQDRYGSHFYALDAKKLQSSFQGTSGAEQDRYGSHFYGVDAKNLPDRSSFRGVSGAEQDRYNTHFGGHGVDAKDLPDKSSFRGASGAEQDRYGSKFGVDHARIKSNSLLSTSTVGILQSTILPSFGLHSGLSIVAYAASRATGRLDGKDILWSSAPVINAWWSAVGARVLYDSVPISSALSSLTYSQQLLLGGVTAWGARLFYRVTSRAVARGEDDHRYTAAKKDPGFWNKSFFSIFLPEAIFQTLITLPLTIPFRAPWASAAASPNLPVSAELIHGLAVFLFTSGFALEVLADSQLATHQKKSSGTLNQEGVWSIVRHPNYLGDTLVHASFPLLLAGAGLMHPLTLLGPAANYVFLRYVSGDKENEASQEKKYRTENQTKYAQLQEYKTEKNSFWPKLNELGNSWLWVVVGAGVGGVVLEKSLRGYFKG